MLERNCQHCREHGSVPALAYLVARYRPERLTSNKALTQRRPPIFQPENQQLPAFDGRRNVWREETKSTQRRVRVEDRGFEPLTS
jgi:hypothetical protein